MVEEKDFHRTCTAGVPQPVREAHYTASVKMPLCSPTNDCKIIQDPGDLENLLECVSSQERAVRHMELLPHRRSLTLG